MLNRTLRLLRALAVFGVCALVLQLDSAGERLTLAPGGLALIEWNKRWPAHGHSSWNGIHSVLPFAPFVGSDSLRPAEGTE